MLRIVVAAVSISIFLVTNVQGADASHTATVVRIFGDAKIFTNPSDKADSIPAPRALFDGKNYTVKKAARGDLVNLGDVIQTGKGSRVRLIYPNGDEVTISANTAFKVGLDKDNKPFASLLMGQMRSTVDKDGPRSGMHVSTRTMSMGIRGTDFYVEARGEAGVSEVSVFRGEVEAKTNEPDAKIIQVPAGYTVAMTVPVKAMDKKAVMAEPKVKPITKEQIVLIDKATTVEKPATPVNNSDPKAREEDLKLAALEKKAVESTIKDIKRSDPELYKVIAKDADKIDDVEKIKIKAARQLIKKAPSTSAEKTKVNLKESDKDVYDKYYTPHADE